MAGVVGVLGAIGATLLVATHPFGHHPSWHVVIVSTVWSGLLIVSFAVVFLKIRTPSLPLARSALVGILGLGLAGICGAVCPDQHFLHWFAEGGVGGPISQAGGMAVGALCFGLMTTFVFGGLSAFLVIVDSDHQSNEPWIPAGILLVLLLPGVALQSVDTSFGVFAGWLVGTALGAYFGVAGGMRARDLLAPQKDV